MQDGTSTFYERFVGRRKESGSILCVGLDPDPDRLPSGYTNDHRGWMEFFEDVVIATADVAAAYKPNLAFFEAMPYIEVNGLTLLNRLLHLLRQRAPHSLLIGDAKRGDIGNTAKAYASAFFEALRMDAITANPYMGMESLRPFYENYPETATIVLCLTSNAGATEYQLVGDPPLYERVAADTARLNEEFGNLWLVVGATREADRIRRVRELAPRVPLLVPGVGAQGGDLEAVIDAAGPDILVNATRSIIYAAEKREDVREKTRTAALEMVRVMERHPGMHGP